MDVERWDAWGGDQFLCAFEQCGVKWYAVARDEPIRSLIDMPRRSPSIRPPRFVCIPVTPTNHDAA